MEVVLIRSRVVAGLALDIDVAGATQMGSRRAAEKSGKEKHEKLKTFHFPIMKKLTELS